MRWSAAKYLARIAERIPAASSHQITEAVLETFEDSSPGPPDVAQIPEHAWHGACLSLAELARRGAIPLDLVGQTLDCVLRVRLPAPSYVTDLCRRSTLIVDEACSPSDPGCATQRHTSSGHSHAVCRQVRLSRLHCSWPSIWPRSLSSIVRSRFVVQLAQRFRKASADLYVPERFVQ